MLARRRKTTIAPAIALRPVEAADEPFLYRVYAGTREEELAPVPWTAAQKDAFLRQQFAAQHRHYREHYPDAAFGIVLCDSVPAGGLYVARWPDEIRIVDIALLPEYRNRGIGGALLRDLLAEGARTGRRVSIHVELFNPAWRLYERLGFAPVANRGVYLLLEWSPSAGERGG